MGTRHRRILCRCLLWSLSAGAVALGCGAAGQAPVEEPTVECQYVTLPPRFCGLAEEEMLWRESSPAPARVCNACFFDDECLERSGGRCVELPGRGCEYSAFVCVYPGDPCADAGAGCSGRCINHGGLALCDSPDPPPH
jgi:hypothetical protein